MLQSKEKTSWIIFFLLSNSYGNIGQSVTEQDSNLGFRTFCVRCRASRAAALRPFRSLRLSKSQAHFFFLPFKRIQNASVALFFTKKVAQRVFWNLLGGLSLIHKNVFCSLKPTQMHKFAILRIF